MEHSESVIQNLLYRDIGILPGKNNARCNVLQDSRCHLASWLIQYIGEVVFRQHGVSRIRTVSVRPRLVLVFATSVNDTTAARFELC